MEKSDKEPKDLEQTAAAGDPTPAENAPDADADAQTAGPVEPPTAETDAPVAAEQTSETLPPIEESVATTPPPAKAKGSWIGAVALLLAICALVLSGYGYHRFDGLQKQQASDLAALTQRLDQGAGEITQARRAAAGVESQLAQFKQQLDRGQQSVNELQDRLTRGMQQVSKIQGNSRKDWLLAEVEYLMRLANQRVLMENSPVGALALLKSADTILKETDDVSIYNVRKALAKDIAALETVPKLDVDGTFLKLAALNEQVANLRIVPLTDKSELPGMLKEITPDSVSESWDAGLSDSWSRAMDKLGNLIVIQHRDEPIEPLLSPEQNYFLQQNLHLMLEQAQLALLQGKQGSYDAALAKAHAWIGTYFQADDATTQGLLRGLSELKSVQVAPTLPDISGSLTTLKAYLSQLHDGKGAA